MQRTIDRFQPYFILGFLYLASNIFLRSIDFFLLAKVFSASRDAVTYLRCILNDAIWCGYVFTLCLPVYHFLNRRSHHTAIMVCSVLFSTLFLLQAILVIYAFFSGKLLDKEIFMRPFTEMYMTVRSYGSIGIFFLAGLAVVISFSFLAISIIRRTGGRFRVLFLSSAIILFLSVFFISYPTKLYGYNTQSNRFIINKALYFIYEEYNYAKNSLHIEYPDTKFLSQFTTEYPHWQLCDSLYPFLRSDLTPDVLSPYFTFVPDTPCIVFIVVESLGRGISGENAYSGSFTPFLDSLARHSLYWENCLTTAHRSFGILPSLLGSLPNGNKGFQFGDMPAHTSLVRLLKENGYRINMFYAGYYEFDCVRDFMTLQGTDYFSPYYEEYVSSGFSERYANEWGYADGLLFSKSLEDLTSQHSDHCFNLFVTLTTHNKLDIPGKEKYVQAARSINRSLTQRQQKANIIHLDHLASYVYTDNTLRMFFRRYKERPDFGKTIFVITGDHYVSNFGIPNRLSLYHVPLIIYSPLLKMSGHFKSLVSVLDVAPSLWSMLCHQYKLKKPECVHWLSDGLDTTASFACRKKILLMQDNRDIKEFVYDRFFFSYDSIYEITPKLGLVTASPEHASLVADKYHLFKAVAGYAYNENKLMPDEFHVVNRYFDNRLKRYSYPDERFVCLKETRATLDGTISKIKITARFKLRFDTFDPDVIPLLVFQCRDTGNDNILYSSVEANRLIMNEGQLMEGIWYDVNISREFYIHQAREIEFLIYFRNFTQPGKCRYRIKDQKYVVEGKP